jgi:hypothetical protein
VAIGCGQKAGDLSAAEMRAFETASPEVKQQWQLALEGAKTNGYVVAQTVLYDLSRLELSAEQRRAVQHELVVVVQKFNAALEKGDPAAQEALADLRQNPPNRPR